jgi:nucleotide-binding universal stress UspA family protein
MLRSILIGLDGSEYSQVATSLGIRWAKKYGCKLAGIGVVDEPAIWQRYFGQGFAAARLYDETLDEMRHRVDDYVELFQRRCEEAGVNSIGVDLEGEPPDQLLLEAQRHDLMLLGRETFFHERVDPTLDHIMRHTPRPVITAPSALPEGETAVIAYDGSLQAAKALQVFWASGLWKDREVVILSLHEDENEAKIRAGNALQYLALHDIEARTHTVVSKGHVGGRLLEESHKLGAEFLVMGAYGKRKLKEFLLGSVTEAVIREATLPVFLYH